MDEHQKQNEEAAEKLAKKIDEKFTDGHEELGTVSKLKHQGVILLNGYKKKPNFVKDK